MPRTSSNPAAAELFFPQLAARFACRPLGCFPTAVAPLEALSRSTSTELWVKRDDATARPLGGSKIRKLEFLLAASKQAGARRLITTGGIGSNHIVATALHASEPVTAVVVNQPATEVTLTNLARALELGVELIPARSRPQVVALMAKKRLLTPSSYVIEPGGSSPLGALGYVVAAFELRRQIDVGQIPLVDRLYLPLGSGGAMAGLVVGLAMVGLPIEVVGVRVVEAVYCNRLWVATLVGRIRALLGGAGLRCGKVGPYRVENGYAGDHYGEPTDAAERAVAVAAESEGLFLESTYSGKALAALLEQRPSGKSLFWLTFDRGDSMKSPDFSVLHGLEGPIARWIRRD
jgi:D-cysteine desulfhydrase